MLQFGIVTSLVKIYVDLLKIIVYMQYKEFNMSIILCDEAKPFKNLYSYQIWIVGRFISVGIATRYRLDGLRFDSRLWVRFSPSDQTDPGTHPASCTVRNGTSLVVKLLSGVDHP